MKIDRIDCQTHITALCHYEERLFVGYGQWIEIYNLFNNLSIIKHQVFDCFTVYGVHVYERDKRQFVVVHGNRFFSIYQLVAVDNEAAYQKDEKISEEERIEKCKNFDHDTLLSLKLVADQINVRDWILDVLFYANKIYCLLTSNRLSCYDLEAGRVTSSIGCEQKCTLYTSKFLDGFHSSNRPMVIAAGTVFSEILICEYTAECCTIIDRLIGHEGVLFSIDYKKDLDLLASASDDRTVRLWKFDKSTKCFLSSHVLYGHESRIWQVRLSNQYVISCGENSNLFFWSIEDGKCLFKEKSKKQSYWRLALDETEIFYGASDGSVRRRSIENAIGLAPSIQLDVQNSKRLDFFRSSSIERVEGHLVNTISIAVADTQGKVKVINISNHLLFTNDEPSSSKKPKPVENIETMIVKPVCEFDFGKDYASFNLLDLDSDRSGRLGNIRGEIVRFEYDKSHQKVYKLYQHKLTDRLLNMFTVQGSSPFCELFVIGLNGEVSIWEDFGDKELGCIAKLRLPSIKSQHHVNCAVRLNEHLIVLGDRYGNVMAYQSDLPLKPSKYSTGRPHTYSLVKFYRRVHCSSGVKCFAKHPFLNRFYSCGRAGRIVEYSYTAVKIDEEDKLDEDGNAIWPPFDQSNPHPADDIAIHQSIDLLRQVKISLVDLDWIAKIEFDLFTGELTYVCGFKTTLFIVWNNRTQSIVWTVDASGGSREWALAFSPANRRLNFVYVKNDKLLFTSKLLEPSVVMRPKYHTNTVLCAQPLLLSSRRDELYFITGAEDCDLFVNCLNRTTKHISVEAQLVGHISNVRACAIEDQPLEFTSRGHCLVISVGGNSQLMIWDINVNRKRMLTIKQLVNYFIWGPEQAASSKNSNKKQTIDPQVRFMDVCLRKLTPADQQSDHFLISAICSDATLRLFHLSLSDSYIYLVSTHALANHCPLRMIDHNQLTLITSTDGTVRLMSLLESGDVLDAISFERAGVCEAQAKFGTDHYPLAMVINQSDCNVRPAAEQPDRAVLLHTVVKQHQSGINSIDCLQLADDRLLVLTSGEDTSLGYMVIEYRAHAAGAVATIEEAYTVKVKSKGNWPSKHCSMVSKVKILNSSHRLLLTASWDKRIKIWQFKLSDDDQLELICRKTIVSSVANISEVIVHEHQSNGSDSLFVIVLGDGRETLEINL